MSGNKCNQTMLCTHCMGREATIYIEDINAGTRVGLCVECAAQGCSLKVSADAASPQLLEQMASAHFPEPGAAATDTLGETCPDCGMTKQRLRLSGMMGCQTCYLVYADEIASQIVPMHRGDTHCGLVSEPSTRETHVHSLASLRHRLRQAVNDEAYERAAKLRDAIREQTENHMDGEAASS